MIDELARLKSLSPPGSLGRINALVRRTCGAMLRLPPLAADVEVDGPESQEQEAAVDFAEQFSVDVAAISDGLRQRVLSTLGGTAFSAVVLTYIADFVPRVRAGLHALELDSVLPGKHEWDHTTDPADAVFNVFLPAVARGTALDPLTAEIVRLRVRRNTIAGCATRCVKSAPLRPAGPTRCMATSCRMRLRTG